MYVCVRSVNFQKREIERSLGPTLVLQVGRVRQTNAYMCVCVNIFTFIRHMMSGIVFHSCIPSGEGQANECICVCMCMHIYMRTAYESVALCWCLASEIHTRG
mmetsp:Transcript_98757/g.159208  ORF Transcript_98757/g.159208 Transcript_98757/m.159208 type:complete len:103 (+) Transcript_98757:208-516(+)